MLCGKTVHLNNKKEAETVMLNQNEIINKLVNDLKKYSPIIIVGKSGTGKTHMLNELMNSLNDKKVRKLTGEEICVSIIEGKSTYKSKWRNSLLEQSVLLIDDIDYLKKHSILRTEKWDDFVKSIKHKNRFHGSLINTELLGQYCMHIGKSIEVSKQRFYRGRIAHDRHGFSQSEMGAPTPETATDGRANSAGISRLYLTYDRETTLHEIRAAEFDYVSIATFKPIKKLKVVDLKRIGDISPFAPDVDCTALAINREHLQKINLEMSKTMRRGDSPLDYLPTQYICDFVMSIEDENGTPIFDGIEYQSAMRSTGANLAIFYPEKFKCTYCRTYEVTKLTYHKDVLNG